MSTVLTVNEDAYEVFRSVFFDCPPGQSASAAKQALASAIAANPLPLFNWLTDAGIVQHVMFSVGGVSIRMSVKDAPPFDLLRASTSQGDPDDGTRPASGATTGGGTPVAGAPSSRSL